MKRSAKIALFVLAAAISGCGDRAAINKGREFLEMGDLTRALTQFEKAVESNPRSAAAHYLLAKTYCLCDSSSSAVKEYSLLAKLDLKLADDTLLRQKVAVFLGMEPYPSTRLTEARGNDAFPSISSDGGTIAFSSKRDGNPELYVMASDGSGQKRITRNKAIDYGPSFSPDGKRLLFVSDRDGNDEIYLYEMATGKERRLTYSKNDDWLPCFSPDGQEMFWVSDRSGKYAIWRMTIKINEAKTELSPTILYEDSAADVAFFTVDSGKLLIQKEIRNQGFLIRMGISDGGIEEINMPSFRTGIPTLSLPDGKTIAYVSASEGNDEICLFYPGQKHSLRLTNNRSEDFVFGFSPDGKAMLYDSDRGGDRDVYLMHLDKLISRDQLLSKITNL